MKRIEDIVAESRDLFDDKEPFEGHFERFSRKLDMWANVAKPKRSIVPYLLKAAVVTLLVTLSSLWTWDNFIRPSSRRMTLSDVSPEYREVESYYISQISFMEGELLDLNSEANPEQNMMLQEEINSMDSIYLQLQKELKANPNDERIINAMIEHYQTKVRIMSFIVDQLTTIKTENFNIQENENVNL